MCFFSIFGDCFFVDYILRNNGLNKNGNEFFIYKKVKVKGIYLFIFRCNMYCIEYFMVLDKEKGFVNNFRNILVFRRRGSL